MCNISRSLLHPTPVHMFAMIMLLLLLFSIYFMEWYFIKIFCCVENVNTESVTVLTNWTSNNTLEIIVSRSFHVWLLTWLGYPITFVIDTQASNDSTKAMQGHWTQRCLESNNNKKGLLFQFTVGFCKMVYIKHAVKNKHSHLLCYFMITVWL